MIDDERVVRECGEHALEYCIHCRVVLQDEMRARRAGDRLFRRLGDRGAKPLERSGLRDRPVPHRDREAVCPRPLDHAGAEQSGSEKRHSFHASPPRGFYNRTRPASRGAP